MAGILYIVATPIGNLDDMPPRVAATFGAADFVAAEDTRVTMRLLNHLGLKKPMVSDYEHALQKGEGILRRMEAEGYVERRTDSADRRVTRVYLTEKGKAFDRDHLRRISMLDREAIVGFSEKEEEPLLSLLSFAFPVP